MPPSNSAASAKSYLTLTLHAHLPYVVNHGTWPHGIEWLHEAAAETYLPMLRMLGSLESDGIALHCNLNLSPILLEQFAHQTFRDEFPKYLERKIASSLEDESFFLSTNEPHYAETARFWHHFFARDLEDFRALNSDIGTAFRGFFERGAIDIITSGATHGYLPLLGTDESVRAQVRTAVATHRRHMGVAPRGMWAPECGYRPAGAWIFPVLDADDRRLGESFQRIGVEQAMSESGIRFFFADTHMVEESAAVHSPYAPVRRLPSASLSAADARSIYQPHVVDGPYIHGTGARENAVIVFPRDPRTGLQVWSGDTGYPGDQEYLDFHKKRWPGGHRYWRVTGHDVDMGAKAPYTPARAAERVRAHAEHFVQLVTEALAPHANQKTPPILCAPFDAELFGHWWFEGLQWLETVARLLHEHPTVALTTCAGYLGSYPPVGSIKMREGSWGAGGDSQVWLNAETAWTYSRLYTAELFTRDVCTASDWKLSALHQRVVKQLCRELLLLESSDWQFLVTTGAARDYAESRFHTHHHQFNELRAMYTSLLENNELTSSQNHRLGEIEQRDNIFMDIDPEHWARDAKATRPQ